MKTELSILFYSDVKIIKMLKQLKSLRPDLTDKQIYK